MTRRPSPGLDCINRIFPTEIVENVFKFLQPRDLMVADLVCRKWRELGENPKLWTFLKLKMDRRGELSILNIRRLQYLREIIVDWWKGKELEELFLALGKLSNLRKITIQHYKVKASCHAWDLPFLFRPSLS